MNQSKLPPSQRPERQPDGPTKTLHERLAFVSCAIAGTIMQTRGFDRNEAEAHTLAQLRKAMLGQAKFPTAVIDGQNEQMLDAAAMFLVACQPDLTIPLSDHESERVASIVQRSLELGRPSGYHDVKTPPNLSSL